MGESSGEGNRIEAEKDRGLRDCNTTNGDSSVSSGDSSFECPSSSSSPCKYQRESGTKLTTQRKKSIGTLHIKETVVDDSESTKAKTQLPPKPARSLEGEDSEEDEGEYDSDIAQLLRTELGNSSDDSDERVDLSELGQIMADIESEEERGKECGKKRRNRGADKSDDDNRSGETSEDDADDNKARGSNGKCETTISRC